jgi:hypothetical protein
MRYLYIPDLKYTRSVQKHDAQTPDPEVIQTGDAENIQNVSPRQVSPPSGLFAKYCGGALLKGQRL